MVFQNGISLKIGKIAYELLYRGSSKYTIVYHIVLQFGVLWYTLTIRF